MSRSNSPYDASKLQDRNEGLDALRGLAVLVWLVSAVIVPALYLIPKSPATDFVIEQLSPSFWHGATVYDLALPMFLFVAGASIAPAFKKRREAGHTGKQLAWRIVRRVVLLIAIGIICEGGFIEHWPSIRVVGAFQRIAVCYALVAALHLFTGWRFQVGLLGFVLVDYWAILAFEATGDGNVAYSPETNVAAYVDALLLPGRKYFGTWDPNGILTTLPAVAVTITGLLACKLLQSEQPKKFDRRLWLFALGMAAFNAGFLWDFVLPINPYLWTPSFCLLAVGVGCILLGAFDALLSVAEAKIWATPLVALGRNALITTSGAALVQGTTVSLNIILPKTRDLFPQGTASPLVATTIFLVALGGALWLNQRRTWITV